MFIRIFEIQTEKKDRVIFVAILLSHRKPRRILLFRALKTSLELVNTSACVNKLLLTCKEGMTLRANFNSELSALCGSCLNRLAARTSDYALFILGMHVLFHYFSPHKISSLFFDSDFTSGLIISLFFTYVNTF